MQTTLPTLFRSVWKYLKYFVAIFLAVVGLILAYVIFVSLFLIGFPFYDASSVVELAALIILFASCVWSTVTLLRKPRETVPVSKSKTHWLLRILATLVITASLLIVLVPVLLLAPMMIGLWFETNPGPFDRPRMEHIVDQVRHQDFKGDKVFIADAAGNLKEPVGHNWDFKYNAVEASRADNGTLSIAIVTKNLGHAGTYGFAYSDKILTPEKDPNSDGLILDVPGEMNETTLDSKIDDHWWKVVDSKE